jgi:hypothetical protein
MKITCTTTFLDGRRRFENGDVVTVDDADAARFIEAGWAEAHGDQSGALSTGAAPPAELSIHNSVLGSTATMKV